MIASINTNNTNPKATSFKGAAPKLFTIKNEGIQSAIIRMGKFSTPENRIIMGATALALQPAIDWGNKKVNEKTRKYSVARTIAKIIAGTVVGTIVRVLCINWMGKFTKTEKDLEQMAQNSQKITKWNTVFVPSSVSKEAFEKTTRKLVQHRKALGSIIALGAMLFTNFLIDAPLTKLMTNSFFAKMNAKEKLSKEREGK